MMIRTNMSLIWSTGLILGLLTNIVVDVYSQSDGVSVTPTMAMVNERFTLAAPKLEMQPIPPWLQWTKIRLFNQTTYMCPSQSCKDRCGEKQDNPNLASCYCDPECFKYNDCCIDYRKQCKNSMQNVDEDVIQSSTDPLPKFSCHNIPGNWGRTYYRIDQCKKLWNADTEIKEKCEATTGLSVVQKVPVFSSVSGHVYKNILCALCNDEDRSNIQFWDARYVCDDILIHQPRLILACGGPNCTASPIKQPESTQEIASNLNYSSLQKFTKRCKFKITLKGSTRKCNKQGDMISTCNEILREKIPNFIKLSRACSKYVSVISARSNMQNWFKDYRNTHCALCNGDDQSTMSTKCIAPSGRRGISSIVIASRFPQFSILLDFSHSSGTSLNVGEKTIVEEKSCAVHEVYETYLEKCKQLICSSRHIPINGSCVPCPPRHFSFNNTCKPMLVRTVTHFLSPVATLIYQGKLTFSKGNAQKDILTHYTDIFKILRTKWNFFGNPTVKKVDDLITVRINFTIKGSTFDDYNTTTSLLNRLSNSLDLENHPIKLETVQVDRGELFCVNHQKPTIYKKITAAQLEDQAMLQARIQLLYDFNSKGTPSIYKLECQQAGKLNKLNCTKKISYSPDEYTLVNNTVKIVNTTKNYKEYELVDGNAIVCTEYTRAYNRSRKADDFFIYDESQSILTIIGTVLSLICLAFTLLTFLLFSFLRTSSGKSAINLAICIFLAQLLMITGQRGTTYKWLCIILAILQHYFWLAAFFWMNARAFDICRTFTRFSQMIQNQGNGQKRALLFSYIYSYGLSGLIVILSLIVDLSTDLPFSYGNENFCWISGNEALIVIFATPIGFVIITNAIFFTVIVYNLHKMKKDTALLGRSKKEKESFYIYLKLCSFMGFTWIFGFLAAFTKVLPLWYVFIIFNSIQGVYIFFAFCCTRKVWRHYKRLCSCKKTVDYSSTMSSNKQEKMTSSTNVTKL